MKFFRFFIITDIKTCGLSVTGSNPYGCWVSRIGHTDVTDITQSNEKLKKYITTTIRYCCIIVFFHFLKKIEKKRNKCSF